MVSIRPSSARHTAPFLLAVLLLTACSGSEPLGSEDLERRQDAADDVARLVVSTLVTDLDASPPGGDSLGRGQLVGCGDGPDQASYFVDTFVTYDVVPAATAARQVAAALRDAGLEVTVDPATGAVSTSRGDVTADLTTQEKGGGSAGQNIYVSTACLTIGERTIKQISLANGRDVASREAAN